MKLDLEYIKAKVANPNIKIEIFQEIDSTNKYLHQFALNTERRICISESQTNGRGRVSKVWHSPKANNIYFSYLFHFKHNVKRLNGLSIIVGLAAIEAIKEVIGEDYALKLKWSNDGLFENAKFMGNLVELVAGSNGESSAIMGIGINVNMLQEENEISQEWTSLMKICGREINRNDIIVSLIHNLNYFLESFSKTGLKDFLHLWQKIDAHYNKNIQLTNNVRGIAKGIDLEGNLLIETDSNTIQTFNFGEVSIIKNDRN